MRRHHYAAIFMGVVVVAMTIYYVLFRSDHYDNLRAAVHDIGFVPLYPPNDANIVGSFYYLALNGGDGQPVCAPSNDFVKPLISHVNLPSQATTMLRQAHENIGAEILSQINAKFGANFVDDIDYSFENVTMDQLDGTGLRVIEDELFSKSKCEDIIGPYITSFGLVCQVQAAVKATVHYTAKRKDGTQVTAKADANAIAQNLGVDAEVVTDSGGESKIEGTALYYGVRLKPLCMTRQDFPATAYPQGKWSRAILYMRMLWAQL